MYTPVPKLPGLEIHQYGAIFMKAFTPYELLIKAGGWVVYFASKWSDLPHAPLPHCEPTLNAQTAPK